MKFVGAEPPEREVPPPLVSEGETGEIDLFSAIFKEEGEDSILEEVELAFFDS